MDALGKAGGIRWILSAGDDALMRGHLPMKPAEITVIVRQDRALFGDRILEDISIGNLLAAPSRFLYSSDVMAEPAQLLDNRKRKVLIGI